MNSWILLNGKVTHDERKCSASEFVSRTPSRVPSAEASEKRGRRGMSDTRSQHKYHQVAEPDHLVCRPCKSWALFRPSGRPRLVRVQWLQLQRAKKVHSVSGRWDVRDHPHMTSTNLTPSSLVTYRVIKPHLLLLISWYPTSTLSHCGRHLWLFLRTLIPFLHPLPPVVRDRCPRKLR